MWIRWSRIGWLLTKPVSFGMESRGWTQMLLSSASGVVSVEHASASQYSSSPPLPPSVSVMATEPTVGRPPCQRTFAPSNRRSVGHREDAGAASGGDTCPQVTRAAAEHEPDGRAAFGTRVLDGDEPNLERALCRPRCQLGGREPDSS